MQTIFIDEDEERHSTRTNLIDTVICTRKIYGYLEGEYIRRF